MIFLETIEKRMPCSEPELARLKREAAVRRYRDREDLRGKLLDLLGFVAGWRKRMKPPLRPRK